MRFIAYCCLALLSVCGACAQSPNPPAANLKKVGGPCEGCEAIYECPVPFKTLHAYDSLPGFPDDAPILDISGTIYKADGKTPAAGVVLYIYHTDQSGRYALRGDENGWARRHGYIRGWIRSDEKGGYHFRTHIPASYPGTTNARHIHPVVLEENKTAYWLEEWLFDDDILVTAKLRNLAAPRGGRNILFLTRTSHGFKTNHDIFLGLHIPGY